MKILFLIDSLHSIAAGSERQIYKLIDGLVSAGHDVSLTLLRHTDFTRQLGSFLCPLNVLNIHSIVSMNALKKMAHLRQQVIRNRVDVIHAYFPDSCILAPLFLKTIDAALFTSRRDMGLIYQGKPAWIYCMLSHRTDAVISNSHAVSHFVARREKLPNKKCEVIFNGIEDHLEGTADEQLFHHRQSTKLILVANIKPVKRTLDAVIAVSELIIEGIDIELTLIGEKQDSNYALQIDEMIRATNTADRIRMTGSLREPRRFLSQAHIGLLISESEGLSNTIMEYMDAGLPVIATKVGGNPELVCHNKNGLLIEKGNIAQLKTAILSLISDQPKRDVFGSESKLIIQQEFSIAALVSKHEALYLRHSRKHNEKNR